MKFLLTFCLLTSFAFAQEGAKPEASSASEVVKMDKQAAYKAAKEACLKENKDLKKNKLRKCIISKTK